MLINTFPSLRLLLLPPRIPNGVQKGSLYPNGVSVGNAVHLIPILPRCHQMALEEDRPCGRLATRDHNPHRCRVLRDRRVL